jgi:hypothetical protein
MHLRGGSRKNNLQKRKKEAQFRVRVEVANRQEKVKKKTRREERRELARSELKKALTCATDKASKVKYAFSRTHTCTYA